MSSCSTRFRLTRPTPRTDSAWRRIGIGLCLWLALAAPGLAAPLLPAAKAPALPSRGTLQLALDFPSRPGPAAGSLAVLYPDLGEPYRSIFSTIIAGIQETAGLPLRRYPLGPGAAAGLDGELGHNGTRAVVALGRQGLKVAAGLAPDLPVVAGGVLSVTAEEDRSLVGISLTPDPAVLFTRLKSLMPDARRVIVVYDPAQNAWLIRLAQAAARAQGLELVAEPADSLAEAARLYRQVFATADARHDAIWLPQDNTTVDEDTILPLVLKDAWGRGVAVFSSSFLHVRKGVLFALYPDNLELGRALGRIAQETLAGERQASGMQLLRSVLTAVNLRTASHLGLNLEPRQQHFDFVFPEP